MEAQIELSKVKQEAESKILAKNHMIADLRKITGAELDNSQGKEISKVRKSDISSDINSRPRVL